MKEPADQPQPLLSARPVLRWDVVLFLGLLFGLISALLAVIVGVVLALVVAGNVDVCVLGFLATWLLAMLALFGNAYRKTFRARFDFHEDRVVSSSGDETQCIQYVDVGHVGFWQGRTLQLHKPGTIIDIEVMRIDLRPSEAGQAFGIIRSSIAKSGVDRLVSFSVDHALNYSRDVRQFIDPHANPVRWLCLHYQPGNRWVEKVRVLDIHVEDEPTPRFHLLKPRNVLGSFIVQSGTQGHDQAPAFGMCVLAEKGTDLFRCRRYDVDLFTGDAVLVGRGCYYSNPLIRKRRANEDVNEFEFLGHSLVCPPLPLAVGYYGAFTLDGKVAGRIQLIQRPLDFEVRFHQPTGLLFGLLLALIALGGRKPMGYPHWHACDGQET